MRIDTTKRLRGRDLESPVYAFTDSFEYNFSIDQTIEDVLLTLQSKKAEKHYEVFYVTDKENVLQGTLTLTDILYNPKETRLIDIIETDYLKTHKDDSLEKALKLLTTHQIVMLPVIDDENRFVGVLEILPPEETLFKAQKVHYRNLKEDIFQFIGFSIEQKKWNSSWAEYRLRMPWLLCNLVGGLICALISEAFSLTLVQFVVLAFFIPLILTLSESVAIQSMTLSLRFLHIRRINWRQVWRRLFVESRATLMLAITNALAVAFFYFAWNTEPAPLFSIGLSVIVAMLVSSLFGAFFPIILHALRLDPKVAAGPVVLMMTDIFTTAIYLSLSTYLLMK